MLDQTMTAASQSDSRVSDDAKAYYDAHGYVVVPGVFSSAQLDPLLDAYARSILPSTEKFYRQNTSTYERNRFTDAGHVIQSFLDIHNYEKFPAFREAALNVYFNDRMLSALHEVTGYKQHNLMQSMLFDANATTPPHQDWWYLDTVPAGNLLGAWIALEDIEEDAGRFYVMAGTHRVSLHGPDMPHSTWLSGVRSYMQEHPELISSPALHKGDVLFWNSRTIHGSHPTKDMKFSRKSLTGHYMPSELTFGNLFTTKPWVRYQEYNGHKYFANQPEYSTKAEVVSKVKMWLYDSPKALKLARQFQKKSITDT